MVHLGGVADRKLTAGVVVAVGSFTTAVGGAANLLTMPTWAQFSFGGVGIAALTGVLAYNKGWNDRGKGGPPSGEKKDDLEQLKARAKRFVQYLHRRWFSAGPGRLDADHRVSLFVPVPNPEDPKEWVCLARTIHPVSAAAKWPHVTDDEELENAGLVVLAAVDQRDRNVDGVPKEKRGDAAAIKKYQQATFISAKDHALRSWKHCSMAVRVARAKNGPIFCVMVVEREDGLPISVKTHQLLAPPASTTPVVSAAPSLRVLRDICGVELQLAADIWAASWDGT